MLPQTPYQFFLTHAGYSYGPTETPQQGRRRCAHHLARAEAAASRFGWTFEWRLDGGDSTEWTKSRRPPTPTWECIARNGDGNVVASLCSVDFSDGEPWGDPYSRVVQAELACEAFD